MRFITPGIMSLIFGYMLSQFYRTFLAVLSPVLHRELDATPGDLALSSGLWFVAFAAMQPVVGWALDRFGPRRTVAVMLATGCGLGAVIFALATAPWHLHVALALLGAGCAPVLMGAYFIVAREFPPAAFGSLAGVIVGVGSLGDILGAAPLVSLISAIGWRPALWGMVAVTLAVAAMVMTTVRDPQPVAGLQHRGTIRDVLRLRALWFILPLFTVCYLPAAAIRGLWAGPYLGQVYDADPALIGRVTLIMGLAMVMGNFMIGAVVRAIGSVRRTILIANGITALTLFTLWKWPDGGLVMAIPLLTLIGMSGAGYALLMAHARAFLPAHLVGRGVTLLNMFAISGVALMQFGSRPIYQAMSAGHPPPQVFAAIFLFFAVPLATGFALYFLTPEAPAHG